MSSKLIGFGSFTLDLDRFCVHGPAGLVALRRKSFDVLRYLLERRGQVVPKAELLAAVWPDVTVGDDSLTQCVGEIRRAIGDNRQKIIRTVPRRGYLAEVPLPTNEPAKVSEQVRPFGPECRQITVLACRLGDAIAFAKGKDPEDFRETMAVVNVRIREVIERHGGVVGEYELDGIVAYFGYPLAHEQDAERAVRAGLSLIGVAGGLDPYTQIEAQKIRVAIATGLVVIEADGDRSAGPPVVGEAPILVSRLLQLASPGSVVISGGTRQLLGNLFDVHELDDADLKAASVPVVAYRVSSESPIASRFEALRSQFSQIIGREEEIDLLWRRWQQAQQGEGRVVLVTGEPGIGKSRLVRALQERVQPAPCTLLLYHCSPYHQDSALYPVIGQIIRAAGIEPNDDPPNKLEKLATLMRQSSESPAEDMNLLAALLSIPGGERYPLPAMTPQRRKARTISLLIGRLKDLAADRPVLMIFEDVHWIDPTSLELLSVVIDEIKSTRILLLVTARPDFSPTWPLHRHTWNLVLPRFDKFEAEALIAGVTGGKLLPRDLLEKILARSDGVPLFIEELTKSVLDSGQLREAEGRYEMAGQKPSLAIPSTLHGSLLGRLDRLASVKDVAQVGAAIGREFSWALIAAVAALPEHELNAALAELVRAELIFRRGVPPDARYQFKHALVQDAAYASMVRIRRRQLHGLIGRTLVEKFPEAVVTEPEIVARHYAEAGLADEAVGYLAKAVERAVGASAYSEAINHIASGIDLLRQQPSTGARMCREMHFQIALGGACIASKGWTADQTGAAYNRAYELSRQTEDYSQLPKILAGRFVHYHVKGDVQEAQAAAYELLEYARKRRDDSAEMMAHRALGDSLLHVGEFRSARAHLEEALGNLGPRSQPVFVGEDVRTAAFTFLSLCLAFKGDVSEADERWREAIERARSLRDPHTIAFALAVRCRTNCLLLDHKGLSRNVEQLHDLATEHDLEFFKVLAKNYLGWTRVLENRTAEAIALLESGIEGVKSAGAQWHFLFHGSILASAYQRTGRIEDGLILITNLLETTERTGIRYMEADLYRVRAELLVSSSNLDEAEASLYRGLAVAREQQARIFELRIATALARLWRLQGHTSKARHLLAPIYASFGGISLMDLKNATEVLHDLGK